MRYRDRPHARSQTVFHFSDLSPEVIRRLPDALAETAADPNGQAVRVRWPARGSRRTLSADEAAALAPDAVTVLEDGLDDRRLIVSAARLPFTGLPVKLVISGRDLALVCAHVAFDGAQFMEFTEHLLSRSAGLPHDLDPRRPHGHPILTALRAVSPKAITGALAERAARPTAPSAPAPSSADLELETASMAHLHLDEAALTAIRALPMDEPGARASLNMRICSLALHALQEVQRGSLDLPVDVPVDLRRYLPDARVVGNFISVVEVGGLRSADWRPSRLAARMEAPLATGAPLVGMLVSGLGPIKERILGSLRRNSGSAAGELSIAVTMLRRAAAFPEAVWAPGSPRDFTVASIDRWPSPTMVAVPILGPDAQLTVWDEGGQFDLGRFAEAFWAQLDEQQSWSAGAAGTR